MFYLLFQRVDFLLELASLIRKQSKLLIMFKYNLKSVDLTHFGNGSAFNMS